MRTAWVAGLGVSWLACATAPVASVQEPSASSALLERARALRGQGQLFEAGRTLAVARAVNGVRMGSDLSAAQDEEERAFRAAASAPILAPIGRWLESAEWATAEREIQRLERAGIWPLLSTDDISRPLSFHRCRQLAALARPALQSGELSRAHALWAALGPTCEDFKSYLDGVANEQVDRAIAELIERGSTAALERVIGEVGWHYAARAHAEEAWRSVSWLDPRRPPRAACALAKPRAFASPLARRQLERLRSAALAEARRLQPTHRGAALVKLREAQACGADVPIRELIGYVVRPGAGGLALRPTSMPGCGPIAANLDLPAGTEVAEVTVDVRDCTLAEGRRSEQVPVSTLREVDGVALERVCAYAPPARCRALVVGRPSAGSGCDTDGSWACFDVPSERRMIAESRSDYVVHHLQARARIEAAVTVRWRDHEARGWIYHQGRRELSERSNPPRSVLDELARAAVADLGAQLDAITGPFMAQHAAAAAALNAPRPEQWAKDVRSSESVARLDALVKLIAGGHPVPDGAEAWLVPQTQLTLSALRALVMGQVDVPVVDVEVPPRGEPPPARSSVDPPLPARLFPEEDLPPLPPIDAALVEEDCARRPAVHDRCVAEARAVGR